MRIFKNPSNGYHERVGGFSILLALLFGVFYFMAKGVWMHVAIQLVISALVLVSLGPPGIMPGHAANLQRAGTAAVVEGGASAGGVTLRPGANVLSEAINS